VRVLQDTYMGELYPGRGVDKKIAKMIGYTDEDIAKNLPKFTGYVGDAFILVGDLQDLYGIYFNLHTGTGGALATFYKDGYPIGQGQAHGVPLAICRAFIKAWAEAHLSKED
jgi:hypothetical protein